MGNIIGCFILSSVIASLLFLFRRTPIDQHSRDRFNQLNDNFVLGPCDKNNNNIGVEFCGIGKSLLEAGDNYPNNFPKYTELCQNGLLKSEYSNIDCRTDEQLITEFNKLNSELYTLGRPCNTKGNNVGISFCNIGGVLLSRGYDYPNKKYRYGDLCENGKLKPQYIGVSCPDYAKNNSCLLSYCDNLTNERYDECNYALITFPNKFTPGTDCDRQCFCSTFSWCNGNRSDNDYCKEHSNQLCNTKYTKEVCN